MQPKEEDCVSQSVLSHSGCEKECEVRDVQGRGQWLKAVLYMARRIFLIVVHVVISEQGIHSSRLWTKLQLKYWPLAWSSFVTFRNYLS